MGRLLLTKVFIISYLCFCTYICLGQFNSLNLEGGAILNSLYVQDKKSNVDISPGLGSYFGVKSVFGVTNKILIGGGMNYISSEFRVSGPTALTFGQEYFGNESRSLNSFKSQILSIGLLLRLQFSRRFFSDINLYYSKNIKTEFGGKILESGRNILTIQEDEYNDFLEDNYILSIQQYFLLGEKPYWRQLYLSVGCHIYLNKEVISPLMLSSRRYSFLVGVNYKLYETD